MSLTKIGSIGINTGIAFAGVTTIATLNGSDAVLSVGGTVNFVSDVSIGGTVSIAGTLTYEDVTNVDAVGLITARDGIVVGSGITLSKDGDAFHTGVVTATTFVGNLTGNPTGSGANLTNLPAANVTGTLPAISGANLTNLTAGNLTGALPAISGANLTGIAATDNVRTGILDVAGIATFRNTVNIGAAVTISESGIEASGIGITCANINGTQIGGRRNIIINGAMQVAQRGTSSTSEGYLIDCMKIHFNDTDESPTTSQESISSGDTGPYELGFTKYLRITNGNQTSGAGAADYVLFRQLLEAQNIANSGWRSQSATSFLTLSFWVKSSVAQTFYVNVQSVDGTARSFPFSFALSAATWTKVIKTIPGNTSPTVDVDNDTGAGLYIDIWPFAGTNYTSSGVTLESWATYSSSARFADNTSTWYTTNDSTFDVTGMQLEVGPQATAFEHRSFAEELALCQRYFQSITAGFVTGARGASSTMLLYSVTVPVNLRSSPTVAINNDLGHSNFSTRSYRDGSGTSDSGSTPSANSTYFRSEGNVVHLQQDGFSVTDDRSAVIFYSGGAVTFSSEL